MSGGAGDGSHTHTHIHIHNTHDEFILSYQIYFINVPFEKKKEYFVSNMMMLKTENFLPQ